MTKKQGTYWKCTTSDTLISFSFNEENGRKYQFKIFSIAKKPKEEERHIHIHPPAQA